MRKSLDKFGSQLPQSEKKSNLNDSLTYQSLDNKQQLARRPLSTKEDLPSQGITSHAITNQPVHFQHQEPIYNQQPFTNIINNNNINNYYFNDPKPATQQTQGLQGSGVKASTPTGKQQ